MKITLKDRSVFEGTAEEYAELVKLVKLGEGGAHDFEVGDYVVALPIADEIYNVTTTEMRLGEVNEVQDDLIDIKIASHSTRKGYIGDIFSVESKYFRKATDEEKKQYEQAEKFAKLGRKPGEFKKGDIVRVKWILGKGDVDEIAEIKSGPVGDGCGGNYKLNAGNKETLGEDLELIAPVESRVDRVD